MTPEDLDKLTPAPWRTENWDAETWAWLKSANGRVALQFIALARNAFDVMIRRCWTAMRVPAGWAAVESTNLNWAALSTNEVMWAGVMWASQHDIEPKVHIASDPFTCLVEADKWLTEQEKARKG